MMGLGDTRRVGNSRGLKSPASRGSGRAIVFERMPPKERRLVAVEEDPVGYLGKQDPERGFKHVPLVRGH